MGERISNVVKHLDVDVIFNEVISHLKANNSIEYTGSNPYFLYFRGVEFYIFIRNLTKAYPSRSPDVCRIQLHKSNLFHNIKFSEKPLIVLGYCQQYKTFACWSSENIKPRLNGKSNVSLYSRFSEQIPVRDGEIRDYMLSNGEAIKIVNSSNIELLLLDILNIKGKASSTSQLQFQYSTNEFNEDELLTLIADVLNDSSELKAMQICISYFEQHNKDYNLLKIKEIIAKFKTISY